MEDAADGLRGVLELQLVRQLDERITSRRCLSLDAPQVAACKKRWRACRALYLQKLQCSLKTRARALKKSRNVFNECPTTRKPLILPRSSSESSFPLILAEWHLQAAFLSYLILITIWIKVAYLLATSIFTKVVWED